MHLPAALLTELAAGLDACGDWAAVVADIAAQYSQYTPFGWRGPAVQDPTARFAGAVLRRHVQIRDRSCVYMGCRCSARSADLDHTIDHLSPESAARLERAVPRPEHPPPCDRSGWAGWHRTFS